MLTATPVEGDPRPPVLQLIVGDDFKGVRVSTDIPTAIQKDVVTADTKDICV